MDGKRIDMDDYSLSDEINEQLNSGAYDNIYADLYGSKISKLAPKANRTEQILYCLFVDGFLSEPVISQTKLEEANRYSYDRHARYFGAWALDQFEHCAKKLRGGIAPSDESKIRTYKDDILSIYHTEFESGKAYDYIDEWYTAFPSGGYFNPVRYRKLYSDEKGIANAVSVHMLCGYDKTIISRLRSYPMYTEYDHHMLQRGGAFLLQYKTGSDIREVLYKQTPGIEEKVSEMAGENKDAMSQQRIFVTEEVAYTNGESGCAVIYSDFATSTNISLIGYVKNAITEAVPVERWRTTGLTINSEPLKVTQGEIDIARKYLAFGA